MTDSPTTPLRYVLIGCGGIIAPTHIAALEQHPGAQLLAMSDIDATRGAERAASSGCAFYTDHLAMLDEVRPDVVVICAPHPLHTTLALDCFAAGAHVLVEKPMAVSVAEADAMIAQAHFLEGDLKNAQLFAKRAQSKLRSGTPEWLKNDDIINYKPQT